MSVGGFTPCRQLGSYSRRKQVWTYAVLVENKFGPFQVFGDRILTIFHNGLKRNGFNLIIKISDILS